MRYMGPATIGIERDRELGDSCSVGSGLEDHLRSELHALALQIQLCVERPGEAAHPAVYVMDRDSEPPTRNPREDRISHPVQQRHCPRQDRASTGGQSAALYQVITGPEFLHETGDVEEVVAVVGISHDDIGPAGRPDTSLEGGTVAPLPDLYQASPHCRRYRRRRIGAAVVSNDDLPLEAIRLERLSGLPQAALECIGFVETWENYGDLHTGQYIVRRPTSILDRSSFLQRSGRRHRALQDQRLLMRGLGGVALLVALSGYRVADGQTQRSTVENVARSVLTHHNDVERTGAYLYEQILTPQRVEASGLRLARRYPLDATVGTQLLYLHQFIVNGRPRDLVYAVTTANTVHALDARDGSVLWMHTLRDLEDTARSLPRGPVSTPVIDPVAHTMYVVYSTKNRVSGQVRPSSHGEESKPARLDAEFWLVALDVGTGRLLRSTRITASTRRPDGSPVTFTPENHWNRPALLLTHNSLYLAFGPRRREELIEYHGWVLRYEPLTLEQRGVFCTSVHARGGSDTTKVGQGAGIWQSGAGLAADSRGNVYAMTGNARAAPAEGWFGNSFVKLTPQLTGGLSPTGAFSPEERDRRLEKYDMDLGSGGPLVIPGTTLLVGGGKTGTAYLLDTETMRLRQSFVAATSSDPKSRRDASRPLTWNYGPQLHGSLTYWRGPDSRYSYIYLWGAEDFLRAYRFRTSTRFIDTVAVALGKVVVPSGYPARSISGGMLSLSAQGTTRGTGILWSTGERAGGEFRLAAFDAETLRELWSDTLPSLSYMQPPTVAAGMVMVATTSDSLLGAPEVRIYELDERR